MRFLYKKSYLHSFDKADPFLQKLILQTDKQIKDYLESGTAPYGLRIKKIGKKSFEGRVSDRVRIVWVKEGDFVTLAVVGNHEEIQKHLKGFER